MIVLPSSETVGCGVASSGVGSSTSAGAYASRLDWVAAVTMNVNW